MKYVVSIAVLRRENGHPIVNHQPAIVEAVGLQEAQIAAQLVALAAFPKNKCSVVCQPSGL